MVFFPGSVKGLQTGSEVTFRGVQVGEVIEVKAFQTGMPDHPIQIEVVCRALRRRRRRARGGREPLRGPRKRGDRGPDDRAGHPGADDERQPADRPEVHRGRLPARRAGSSRRDEPSLSRAPDDPHRHGEGGGAHGGPHAEDRRGAARPGASTTSAWPSGRPASCSSRRRSGGPWRAPSARPGRSTPPSPRRGETLKSTREVVENLGKETDGLGDEVSQTLAELRDRLERTEKTFATLDATLRGADDARVDVSADAPRAGAGAQGVPSPGRVHPDAPRGDPPGRRRRSDAHPAGP